MKPLGLYPMISSNPGEPLRLDDDYDWYVRHVASQRATPAPTRRKRAAVVTERLVGLVGLFRTRAAAPTARRN